MVALSARTGGSRHTGLAALPHENNHNTSMQIVTIEKMRNICHQTKE